MTTDKNIHDSDDLKGIAPNLSGIPKKQSFKVPDDYFEDFAYKMQTANFKTSKRRETAGFFSYKVLVPILTVIMVGAIYVFNLNSHTDSYCITDDEIAQLAMDYDEYYDEAMLIEGLSSEEIDALYNDDSSETDAENNTEDDAESDEIIEYLLESDIDLSLEVYEI